jgi:hypothetical protein
MMSEYVLYGTNLDVHGGRGDVADEQVREAHFPRAAVGEEAAKPAPEKEDARNLETPCPAPAARALGVERFADDKWVRVGVEVEAGEPHDKVEEAVLELDEKVGEAVEVEGTLVV